MIIYYMPYAYHKELAACVFFFAAWTDWLDGYLARKLDQATAFGAFLDPVADKLIVVVSLIVLVEDYAMWWLTFPSMVIIGREIVISALRERKAEIGTRTAVAVSYLGKFKTACQMLSILVLVASDYPSAYAIGGLVLLYIATFLTIGSMYAYMRAAWPLLKENKA